MELTNNEIITPTPSQIPLYSTTWDLDYKEGEYVNHLKDLGFETVYSPTAGTVWRKKHKV